MGENGSELHKTWLIKSVTKEILDVFQELAQDALEAQDLDSGVEVDNSDS